MTALELREKRAKLWEGTKAFLESHRKENGTLSAEDDAAYTRMEQEINDLGREISRAERQEALDAELRKPVNSPITEKPHASNVSGEEELTGIKAKAYKKSFWNAMRQKSPMPDVLNALQVGTDSEGGYLVPDEFERTLVEGLEEENIFRKLAHTIQTSSGDRKIPVVASKGSASWVDEEGTITESDDSFGQVSIGAYKLGTLIKVSNELLHDSVFDLEQYISKEFARRIGTKEEDAFFNGDGDGKPTGIFNSTGGADVGVTTASATAITADEIIDLFYSLGAPYRKRAVWVLNDATVKSVRKLKDGNGNYLWQPSLTAGDPDTLLGRPVYTSTAVPTIEAGAKVIAFGDFNYYWIADRQGRVFKKLSELYATTDQTGFVATQRVDGKLILSEAIKVLKHKVMRMLRVLKERQEAGVKVTIVTWHPDSYMYGREEHRIELMEYLRNAGFNIDLFEDNCEHYAVIDNEIVWYGSMNLLSKDDVEDNIMRVVSKQIAVELLEMTFKKGNRLHQYELPLPL